MLYNVCLAHMHTNNSKYFTNTHHQVYLVVVVVF